MSKITSVIALPPSARKVLIADIQLIIAAITFGIGFAGQREATLEGMGPLTFNALRYGLSAFILAIFMPVLNSKVRQKDKDGVTIEEGNKLLVKTDDSSVNASVSPSHGTSIEDRIGKHLSKFDESMKVLILGFSLALLNFSGSSFQQVGIESVSSSESAFLTGFYIVFTPVLQSIFPALSSKHGKPKWNTWIAVATSMLGLFIISGSSLSGIKLGHGEMLTLVSAFWWTLFIILTDIATDIVDSIDLTLVNLTVTALISFLASLMFEYKEWSVSHIFNSWKVIVFLGVVECVGFTLGALGQTHAPAHHAAIIYGSELVWATLGGYLLVNEICTYQEFVGCILMVVSTIVAKIDCDIFIKECIRRKK